MTNAGHAVRAQVLYGRGDVPRWARRLTGVRGCEVFAGVGVADQS